MQTADTQVVVAISWCGQTSARHESGASSYQRWIMSQTRIASRFTSFIAHERMDKDTSQTWSTIWPALYPSATISVNACCAFPRFPPLHAAMRRSNSGWGATPDTERMLPWKNHRHHTASAHEFLLMNPGLSQNSGEVSGFRDSSVCETPDRIHNAYALLTMTARVK